MYSVHLSVHQSEVLVSVSVISGHMKIVVRMQSISFPSDMFLYVADSHFVLFLSSKLHQIHKAYDHKVSFCQEIACKYVAKSTVCFYKYLSPM